MLITRGTGRASGTRLVAAEGRAAAHGGKHDAGYLGRGILSGLFLKTGNNRFTMPVVLSCPSCSAQQRLTDEQMLVRLQAQGMLRREKNLDLALVRELLTTAAEQFSCTKCDRTGLVVGDDWEEEWTDETRCLACQTVIPAERLEVFPDTQLCPACQTKKETGEFNSGDAEYCSRCGGLMNLRRRGGAGLAGYDMVCSECGAR